MKLKRLILIVVLVCMSSPVWVGADDKEPLPGVIFFDDGSSIEFFDINRIQNGSRTWVNTIEVDYQNSIRSLSFNQIESIEVSIFKLYEGYLNGNESYWNIKTKTGIVLQNQRINLTGTWIGDVNVDILDDLTGELKSQRFPFVKDNRLNIRKIVFGSKKN